MQTEERQVRQETARRLVPLDELFDFVQARVTIEPVTVAMVADEFEVPDAVAGEALRQLQVRLLESEMARVSKPDRSRRRSNGGPPTDRTGGTITGSAA